MKLFLQLDFLPTTPFWCLGTNPMVFGLTSKYQNVNKITELNQRLILWTPNFGFDEKMFIIVGWSKSEQYPLTH